MSIIDTFEYKHAKKKREELRNFLFQLDTICEMLYDDINRNGVWDLIQHIEEIRLENYMLWHEYDLITKGKSGE